MWFYHHNASPHRRLSKMGNISYDFISMLRHTYTWHSDAEIDSMVLYRNAAATQSTWSLLRYTGHRLAFHNGTDHVRKKQGLHVTGCHLCILFDTRMNGFIYDTAQGCPVAVTLQGTSVYSGLVTWSVSQRNCILVHCIRFTSNTTVLSSLSNTHFPYVPSSQKLCNMVINGLGFSLTISV